MIWLPRGSVAIGSILLLVAAASACSPAEASPEVRSIYVTMHHSRYVPETIDVEPGETIRFVVENTDPIDHEFLVGNERVQLIHEEGTEASHPPKPGEMSVPALTTRVTTYTFPPVDGGSIFGCHLPGHYDYGMRGTIEIA
jgi:uncharacterized cupredoxin-like copper-binding protein